MNDIIEEILIILIILIFVISVVIIYIIQWITKLVWGEYEFTVIQDYEDYYTIVLMKRRMYKFYK